MQTNSCGRCRSAFDIPPSLTRDQRAEIAARAREPGRTFEAVRLLVSHGRLRVGEAKAAVLHLTLPGPACHRCRSPVPADAISHCARCGSLNLNW
jgi:hypothetical protein